MNIKRYLSEESGSVMLEFCLVLPIYLLLFGGTFLMFDITMGRLHLQEANRNLAWIQNDRHASATLINQELYKRVVDYFDARNMLENFMEYPEPVWSYAIVARNAGNNCPKPPLWAHKVSNFKDNASEGARAGMKINYSPVGDFLSKIPLVGDELNKIFNSGLMEMYSGNMPLEMAHVSGVYRGAVGVSSVLYPNKDSVDLYNQAYTFTRAQVTIDGNGSASGAILCAPDCDCGGGHAYHIYGNENTNGIRNEVRPATVNNEMLLLRRKGDPNIEGEITLLGGYGKVMNAIWRNWPVGDSIVDDVQLLFGVQ